MMSEGYICVQPVTIELHKLRFNTYCIYVYNLQQHIYMHTTLLILCLQVNLLQH